MPSPRELTFRPSKLRWTLLLVGSAILFTGSIFLTSSGTSGGWAGIVLFGLGIPISLVQLFSTSNYLRLTPDGFTIAAPFKPTITRRWSDVGTFSTEAYDSRGIKTLELVTYELKPDSIAGHPKASALLAAVGGRLPDTYGMKAKDLAALMNSWRERHAH